MPSKYFTGRGDIVEVHMGHHEAATNLFCSAVETFGISDLGPPGTLRAYYDNGSNNVLGCICNSRRGRTCRELADQSDISTPSQLGSTERGLYSAGPTVNGTVTTSCSLFHSMLGNIVSDLSCPGTPASLSVEYQANIILS